MRAAGQEDRGAVQLALPRVRGGKEDGGIYRRLPVRCGAVRYENSADPMMGGHCHCVDCRKSSGAGHCSHLVSAEGGLTLTGALTTYERPADSGNIVTRSFCGVCGSAILSRNSAMPGMVFVRASSLDDPEVFQPQMVVYASRAPSWDAIEGGLPTFDEMPPSGPPQM